MLTDIDIKQIKKMYSCKSEIYLSPTEITDGDSAKACFKLAIDPSGDMFMRVDGVWEQIDLGGGSGTVDSIVAGTGVTVDSTDPANPIVNATGGGGAPDTPIVLTDGATVTWNMNTSSNAQVTLGGNRTLSITNLTAGDYGTLVIIQGAGGSKTLALPGGSKVIAGNAGVLPLSTPAGTIDIATFYYNGTTLYWNIGKNYT